MEIFKYLEDNALFIGLKEEEKQELANIAEYKEFKTGDIIIKEKEMGESFFIILEGRLLVKLIEQNKIITELADSSYVKDQLLGNFFGEMVLFEYRPRSASVLALTDVKLLEFSRNKLLELFMKNKDMYIIFLSNLVRVLNRRLAHTTKQLVK